MPLEKIPIGKGTRYNKQQDSRYFTEPEVYPACESGAGW